MSEEINLLEEIDKYLNHQLQGEALENFLKKKETDPALEALIDSQKKVNAIIIGNRLSAVRKQMRSDFSSGTVKPKGFKIWMGGFLVILIGVVILASLPQSNKKTKSEQLILDSPVKSEDVIIEIQENGNKELQKTTILKEPTEKRTIISTGSLEEKQTNSEAISVDPMIPKTIDTTATLARVSESTEPINEVSEKFKTESTVSTEKEPETLKPDCSEPAPSVSISNTASCSGKSNGTIDVTIKSGKVKMYSISNEEGITIKSKDGMFTELAPGNYQLIAELGNHCSKVLAEGIEVTEKNCFETKTFNFTPAYGETFKFPIDKAYNGKIEIKDRSGRTIYSNEIRSGFPSEWDGTENSSGNLVSPGVYLYFINGENGDLLTGQVLVY